MKDKNDDVLLIDEEFSAIINEEDCASLKPIIVEFVENYIQNRDKPVEEWLSRKMQEDLPEKKPEEIHNMTVEIISTFKVVEEKKKSLSEAVESGIGKESWFASETQKTVSDMSAQETVKYLSNLDGAVRNANEALENTIRTQSGAISQNHNLDGFIAEQYHVQTFNLNAEASGSQYRAKVLEPNGKGYAKNSVDIQIVDGNGKVVRRYQSKYCKDAEATKRAFEHGDYRGQQKLVPEGQQNDIVKKCTTVLEAPDGTTSNPLTKAEAKQRQNEAQSGNLSELDWNEYRTRDLSKGIARSIGGAAVQGAAISVGFDIAQRLWNGEEINGEEVVETALSSGADGGIKAAAAGAVKVGAEKGFVPAVLKDTSAAASVAIVAVENIKVLGKMMSGELSGKEGVEKMEQTTVATVAGLSSMGKGSAIGATIGAAFGPVGSAIGGFLGGTIAYMAGSKIGETITKGVQKVRNIVLEGVRAVGSAITAVGSAILGGIKTFFSVW